MEPKEKPDVHAQHWDSEARAKWVKKHKNVFGMMLDVILHDDVKRPEK